MHGIKNKSNTKRSIQNERYTKKKKLLQKKCTLN